MKGVSFLASTAAIVLLACAGSKGAESPMAYVEVADGVAMVAMAATFTGLGLVRARMRRAVLDARRPVATRLG